MNKPPRLNNKQRAVKKPLNIERAIWFDGDTRLWRAVDSKGEIAAAPTLMEVIGMAQNLVRWRQISKYE